MGTKISELTALTTAVSADLFVIVDTTASPDTTKKITLGNLFTSPTFTGTVTLSALTASEIVATDASKILVSLAVATYPSLTELSYVKGVTSALQTQIDAVSAKTSSGTYTGNGAQNRAIAHGLTGTPKMVIINRTALNELSVLTTTNTLAVTPTVSTNPVTAIDGTNFYVGINASGNQTNVNTAPYTWVAFL